MFRKTAYEKFPHAIAAIFVIMFIWLAVDPADRRVWIAEVFPVVIVFLALVLTIPKFRFSNTSYALMAFWLYWHTIGGHYTFAHVPFEWLDGLFGDDRNHFDRIGHFSVGFYAFPMTEWLLRKKHCGAKLAALFSLFFIMAVAAGYEIIEWQFAVMEGGDAGHEFLGSQGDIWDAQKDMLLDTLGAVSALILYFFMRPDRRLQPKQS